MSFLASLVEDLSQPEYIHVLLNPLPVYGLAVGVLGLVIALIVFHGSRAARLTALILIAICAGSIWPVAHYGRAGYDRVLSMSDSTGEAWLKAHVRRADQVIPFYYTLAGLAVLAILVPFKQPKSAIILAWLTLVLAVGTLGAGSWVAYAGGKIRHSEFRNGPPPIPTPLHNQTATTRSER